MANILRGLGTGLGLALWLALWAVTVAVPAQAQSREPISGIRVEGNQRIEAATVRSYMGLVAGDKFDPSRVDRALKSLFATGLFADVTIRRDGSQLVVRVVENPVINQLAFEGNSKISDDDLRGEVQLRSRVVYTRSRVQADVQRLIQLYRRSGRFAATVEPKVIQLPQNRVDLVFEINEGPVTNIRKIRILGNKAFTDGQLKRTLATKESRWYRFLTTDDTYDPDRLTVDRELLRKYYLARGYADFRVVSAVAELTRDRSDFFITFTVDEGRVYVFGNVDIDVALKNVDVESLRPLIKTVTGETYNASLIEDTIQDLTFELGRLGFAFVDIRPRIKRNRESGIIDLTYEISQGPRVYVERIDIKGNSRTLDKVIRREFRLIEGDAFNTAKLRRSRQRIRALDFFDNVDIKTEPGSAPDRAVVKVVVKEKPTGELTLGAGFSTAEIVVGDIALRERNLLGRGQDLRASLGLSIKRQRVDVSFTEPYFLDLPISAGVDLFNTITDFQSESSFDQRTTGGRVRLGYSLTENLRQSWFYTLRQDDISNVDKGASRFIADQEGSRISSSVGYELKYDRRNDPLEPTDGYTATFTQELAGLGGTVRDIKSQIRYAHYTPVSKNMTLIAGLRAGVVVGLGDNVEIFRRFFVGGDDFRGFATSGIGPRDVTTNDALGGNVFYVGTGELEFPLGLPSEFGVKGRVFSEIGSLAFIDQNAPGIFSKGTPRVSAGVGFSWRSPFGPVRVDFAKALVKESVDDTEFFRFSFGTRF